MTVCIVPTGEEHAEGLNNLSNAVVEEGTYMLSTKPRTMEETHTFVSYLLTSNSPSFVALDGDKIVGSCGFKRDKHPNRPHVGQLGISLLPSYRDQKIGTALLTETLSKAWQCNMTRLALSVFSDNARAIHLYEKMGFKKEGLQENYALINGFYRHCFLMALLK